MHLVYHLNFSLCSGFKLSLKSVTMHLIYCRHGKRYVTKMYVYTSINNLLGFICFINSLATSLHIVSEQYARIFAKLENMLRIPVCDSEDIAHKIHFGISTK